MYIHPTRISVYAGKHTHRIENETLAGQARTEEKESEGQLNCNFVIKSRAKKK